MIGYSTRTKQVDRYPDQSTDKKRAGGTIKSKSASTRADGIAQRGKTKGSIV